MELRSPIPDRVQGILLLLLLRLPFLVWTDDSDHNPRRREHELGESVQNDMATGQLCGIPRSQGFPGPRPRRPGREGVPLSRARRSDLEILVRCAWTVLLTPARGHGGVMLRCGGRRRRREGLGGIGRLASGRSHRRLLLRLLLSLIASVHRNHRCCRGDSGAAGEQLQTGLSRLELGPGGDPCEEVHGELRSDEVRSLPPDEDETSFPDPQARQDSWMNLNSGIPEILPERWIPNPNPGSSSSSVAAEIRRRSSLTRDLKPDLLQELCWLLRLHLLQR